MAACAPLPENKPTVQVTTPTQDTSLPDTSLSDDPIISDEVTRLPIEEITDNQSLSDNASIQAEEPEIDTATLAPETVFAEPSVPAPSEIVADNRSDITEAIAEITPEAVATNEPKEEPKEAEIDEVIEEVIEEAKIEPEPLDPYSFVGKSQAYLLGMIGAPDYQFLEQGVTIAHYYQPECQLLTFLRDDNGAFSVIHIDVRPRQLGSYVSQPACFKSLGLRAQNHQNN